MSDYTDEELYGRDLIQDSRRWAREELGNEVSQLRQQVAQQALQANRQRCMNALDGDPELASKRRTLNNDPGFLKWLGEIYDLAGVPRMGLLHQAYDVGDADRVRNFFRAYLASKIPQRQRTNERLPMEQTAPRLALRPSQDPSSERRRIWSKSEIAKFYNDCRLGRYDQHEPERLRIEREILAAASQGRVADNAVQPQMPGRRAWE
jgi:hypothetical protein